MENNKKLQELRSEETRARQRAAQQQNNNNRKRDEQAAKEVSKAREHSNDETHLFKTASHPVQPVPMKI